MPPKHETGNERHLKMFIYALWEALFMLQQYELQKHIKVTDDDVVIAYLRGYGNKKNVKNDVE